MISNEEHNKYLSYAFLGYAGFNFFWLCLMFLIFLAALFSEPGGPSLAMVFLVGFAMIFMMALFTLPAAIAGWAGLKKKSWSRNIGIVASITSVTSFPLGTLAGVYGLWFYLSDAWKEVYEDKEYIQRGELPGKEVFERWEMEADRYEREQERVPPVGDWR